MRTTCRNNTARNSWCRCWYLAFCSGLHGTTSAVSCRSGFKNIWRTVRVTCQQTKPFSVLNASSVKWHNHSPRFTNLYTYPYTVWVKKIPPKVILFFSFFHKRLRIFNRFFTHLLHVPMYARLQIFIQLSPTLTKLCHIKRDYLVRIICANCPKRAKTCAFRRLHKSLIGLLIIVCGNSL